MNPLKLKLLSELIDHMSSSQGMDLKSLMDEEKMKSSVKEPMEGMEVVKEDPLSPEKPMMDSEQMEGASGSVGPEVVEGGDEEMSDDELKELLAQLGG